MRVRRLNKFYIMKFLLSWIVLVLVSFAASAAEPGTKPNIVLILADDYGWGSAGCYGAKGVETPNMDRLAREGRQFTQAYAPGSVCSPSRYGLMTGRYYWRTSIKDGEVLSPNAPLHIETNRLTLASLCKGRGYRTAVFGKWHLGMTGGLVTDWSRPLVPGPRQVGFDHYFGMAANLGNGPHSFIDDEEVTEHIPGEPILVQEGKKTTGIRAAWKPDHVMETLTTKVTGWIAANRHQPFFVYFAPNAVHGPIVPNPRFSGSTCGNYGDFIHELDWSVGQVLATLDRLKLTDSTLVVFTSDNGGVIDPKSESTATAIKADLAINGSLRGGKHSEWEGGFREPFIVRWPGKVPANTISDQIICLTDLLATFARVLRVPLPKGNAEDSFDVLRAFTETKTGPPVRDHVILQAADATYDIRMGEWKLVERVNAPAYSPNRNKRSLESAEKKKAAALTHDELFNLNQDPSETKDLWEANNDRAAKMKKVLEVSRDRGFTRPGAGM